MTSVAVPPTTFLSRDGHVAVRLSARSLHLIECGDASIQVAPLPHPAHLAGIAPSNEYIVIAGMREFSLLRTRRVADGAAFTVPLAASVSRLQAGGEGLVWGVAPATSATGQPVSYLQTWTADGLKPVWPGLGQSLGARVVDRLLPHPAAPRVLISAESDDQPFVALLELGTSGELNELWNARDVGLRANGFAVPVGNDCIGVYDLAEVALVCAVDDRDWRVRGRRPLPGGASGAWLVSSPTTQCCAGS